MPFTVSPSSYRGGDYLFQGISNAANAITGTIQHFADTADQADKADALMNYLSQQQDPVTGKPIIDPKTMESYGHYNQRQRARVAGGITAGMGLAQALGHYSLASQGQEWQNRQAAAHAAYYQQQAQPSSGRMSFDPTTTVIKDPVTGESHTYVRTGKDKVSRLAPNKAAPDPIKAEIAKQMAGGETSPTPAPSPTPQPQAPAQGAAGPVRVNSVAEALALQPGTPFIDPQGTLRRR